MRTSIFEEMSGLARAHGAINLGQGFPDFGWPEPLVRRAAQAVADGPHQYPPMRGLPALREAVAQWYAARQGLALAPEGVLVGNGASEVLAAAILALVGPGDTVAFFAPAYDLYLPMIRRAGGVPRPVRLAPPDWAVGEAALAEAFAPPVPRLVILNNPHNPAATVWDTEALRPLARRAAEHGTILLSDEVWEEVRFGPGAFTSMLALPEVAEQTIKVGSAGKIFALTGWKVGWAVGAPALIEEVAAAKQYLGFTTHPSVQAAFAWGLAEGAAWLPDMLGGFAHSRDVLGAALGAEGFALLPSAGTYFLCLDLAASGIAADDRSFALAAVREHGVASIPVSAFYPADPVRSVLRLCFAKDEATLIEAARRLGAARRAARA